MANRTANRGHRKKIKTEKKPSLRALRNVAGIDELHKRVMDAYWACLSPTKACADAGVVCKDPKQYLYELLRLPAVAAYLTEKMEKAHALGIVKEEQLVADLEFMRSMSPWDFFTEDKDHAGCLVMRPMAEISRQQAQMIKKVKTKRTFRYVQEFAGNGEMKDVTLMDVHQEIEFHSRLDVIDKLCRMIGAYRENDKEGEIGTVNVAFMPRVAANVADWEIMCKEVTAISVQDSGTSSGPPKPDRSPLPLRAR